MTTQLTDLIHATVTDDGEVDTLTAKARDLSLTLFGVKTDREGTALVLVGDLEWYHAQWAGEVALVLLSMGRIDDAAMWSRASTLLDERKRNPQR
jgi:hypothetical protein